MIVTLERHHQTISYIVHAGELLEEENNLPQRQYKNTFISSGPELFTGLIKASAYLFLDKNLKKIVIFAEQNDFPDKAICYKDGDFLIWGKKIKNHNIFQLDEEKSIPNELFEQLLYLRLLGQIEQVSLIGVGGNAKISDLISQLDTETGIVVLGKLSDSKEQDQEMINHILSKKIYKKDDSWIGNLYTKITNKRKTKSDLIVYIHSSDLGTRIGGKGYLSLAG